MDWLQKRIISLHKLLKYFTHDRITITATVVMAVVAVLQFITLEQQSQILEEQKEIGKKQSAAFIGVDSLLVQLIVDPITKEEKGYRFEIKFKNYGLTSTKHFGGWSYIDWFNNEELMSFDFSKPKENIGTTLTMLDVGAGANKSVFVGISKEKTEKALSANGKIIIWGSYEYSDIFDDKKHIRFCAIAEPIKLDNQIEWKFPVFKNSCNLDKLF